MFRDRHTPDKPPHSPTFDLPITPEMIDARLAVIEKRLDRLERRWSPGDQRGLDAAMASLGRTMAKERAAKERAG